MRDAIKRHNRGRNKVYSDFDMFPIFTIGNDVGDVTSEYSLSENFEDSSRIVTRDLNYSIIVQYLCTLITLATLLDKPEEA